MPGDHSDDRPWRSSLARKRTCALALVAGLIGGIPAFGQSGDAQPVSRRGDVGRLVDDMALVGAEGRPGDWLSYGRTYKEQRFSPLDQIHVGNVAELGIDWVYDLKADRGIEATPIVVDGVIYATSAWSTVHAVDAATGEPVWDFDPQVDRQSAINLCCGIVNRGVALHEGRVFVGTLDGRLVAVDAATGEVEWDVVTVDQSKPYSITGAPRVVKGMVVIGNGGAEFGVRGYVSAYDAATGELVWRFHTVPGNPVDGFENAAMEKAAETWNGTWWDYGGGGTVWDAIVYDPELDLLYIGVGNGSPWNRELRSPGGGDNLFLCSIVALDADTGEYRWHYQTVPGDTWDYNSNMDIVLADLELGDKTVKALMHAPKNGFFYVIDRKTGELLSAEAFAEVNWATGIDMETGRPIEREGARYEDGAEVITPGPMGAHNWPSMSYNPQTGLAYFPTIYQRYLYADEGVDIENFAASDWQAPSPTDQLGVSWTNTGEHRADGTRGTLQAWDPVAQKQAWEVQLPVAWNPGTLTTAGNLVIQGRADGYLSAYDAQNGKELWRYPLGLGVAAPPITYKIGDKQYVALLVGWGSAFAINGIEAAELGWSYGTHMRRLVAFSLDGETQLPELPPPSPAKPLEAPFFEVLDELAAEGSDAYGQCSWCHGPEGVAGGLAPDLRASPIVLSEEAFANVVRSGGLRANGMPSYHNLSDKQLNALRHYLRQQAEAALAAQAGGD